MRAYMGITGKAPYIILMVTLDGSKSSALYHGCFTSKERVPTIHGIIGWVGCIIVG
jgi:hypothetical protein